MPYINQIRILSFCVFFLPILAINISLYISVNWWQICNDLIPFITTDEICKNTVGSAIGYTFPYFDGEGISFLLDIQTFNDHDGFIVDEILDE